MNSEEHTKEQMVEDLAASLAGGMEEENTAQVETSEKVEQEVPQEEKQLEEEKKDEKKSKKGLVITLSVVATVLLIFLGIYFGVASHYKERFLMGTFVNGVDCSGKTLDEVEAMLQKEVEEYSLTVYKKNGESEIINGTDIEIKYGGYKELKEAFDKQNEFAWPMAMFEERKITAEIVFEYSSEKLDTMIAGLKCMKAENQVAPVSAQIVYQDGKFVIQDEVYGTQLDAAKVSEVIHAGVSSMGKSVNIEESGCYIMPVYKSDSEQVTKAFAEVNKYLSAKITYSLDGIEVVVDKEKIANWISVDANLTPVLDKAKVKAFTDTLGSKYNTSNRGGTITTPTGKEANVSVAGYGRQVGSQAECDKLMSEIKAGQTITRAPIMSRQATPDGQYAWGNTYAEVDISEQHMWYIVNGQVVFETAIVTGKKGVNDTPTGTYSVLEKIPGKYLTGRIVNGKPLYRTWVNYWMRLTWSGIGFHDAGWQNGIFGGDRYVTNGSHGCINMPPAKAKEFYGMISVGTPTVIHY